MKCDYLLKPCPVCKTKDVEYERTLDKTNLLKCCKCGLVYADINDDYVKDQTLQNYGEQAIDRYHNRQTFIDEIWFEQIADKLTQMVGVKNVLDIGCGNGVLLRQFLERRWSVSGVDLSSWAKVFAKKYGYELYLGELEQAGLLSESFDVITSTSTLEHITEPYRHVKEIMRILKPGGIAYFAGIPNYGSLSVRLNFSDFCNNKPPDHVNYFTGRSMRKLFCGTDISDSIEKLSINSYGIPELHRIYHFLRGVMPDSSNDSGARQKVLAKIMVKLYYKLGTLFCLGNKLEVLVVKK